MFKRANKLTALVVAAASIMSVVPAMAADRLATKEGTIEKAYAFKDGKYIYQGYRTDDDNKSVYYNAGDKDKELDDLTDATLTARFDASDAIAKDGSDEYLVDLSNGKVSDEDLASDTQSTAEDKLQSKLKKTDRYGDYARVDSLTQVAADQFGEVWYQYQATTSGAGTTVATADGIQYYGYTDKAGKYVDASKTANIRVYNGSKMVKIDEFDEVTEGITATITGTPVTIAQDKDNFYRVITVHFSGNTVYTSKGAALVGQNQVYLQKVSKTQGDKEKDAYLPKTVETYELAAAATLAGESDVDTAYVKIMSAVAAIADANDVAYDDAAGLADGNTFVGLRVIDGVMYVTEMDNANNDKVKTYKIKFNKNFKVDALNLATAGDLTDTIKVDAYVMKKDGDKDQDVKGDAGAAGVSIDVDGNVWVVNEGKILKSTKAGDFETMFNCDRSLDSLDVYDEGSLVAWDASGDVYTTVQEGKKQAEAEAPVVTPTPAKVGWDKLADGTWNFYDATGTKLASKWANVGGAWYYLKADGVMATGWLNDNGTWYYLTGSGAMATGWINDNGTWYYLNASGAMLANTTVDGYVLGASGAWIK